MKKEYKVINGTFYNVKTSDKVINVLESCKRNNTRIILDYGDTETGISWGEDYDIIGTIGRSTGSIKVPLLIYNARSRGGGVILDHCIIGISESKGKRVLYSHPLRK